MDLNDIIHWTGVVMLAYTWHSWDEHKKKKYGEQKKDFFSNPLIWIGAIIWAFIEASKEHKN